MSPMLSSSSPRLMSATVASAESGAGGICSARRISAASRESSSGPCQSVYCNGSRISASALRSPQIANSVPGGQLILYGELLANLLILVGILVGIGVHHHGGSALEWAERSSSAFATMSSYDETFAHPVAFAPVRLTKILPEIVSELGLNQLRIAETEKYAHVTYFFNGGNEKTYPGEDRVLIPSPRDVATYDLKPEMSAREVAREASRLIGTGKYSLVLLNFANPDMVGHTGILKAAVQAAEVIDDCLKQVVSAMRGIGGAVIITADHGNLEQMVDYTTGEPHTAHTLNPVPCIIVDERPHALRASGILADLAPTILQLMGIPQPREMTGVSLIKE